MPKRSLAKLNRNRNVSLGSIYICPLCGAKLSLVFCSDSNVEAYNIENTEIKRHCELHQTARNTIALGEK